MITESCTLFVFRHCNKIRFQLYCKPGNIGFLIILRLKDCSFKVQYAKMCNMFCFLSFVFLPNKLKSQCRFFPICPFLTSSSSACLSHVTNFSSGLIQEYVFLWDQWQFYVFVKHSGCCALKLNRMFELKWNHFYLFYLFIFVCFDGHNWSHVGWY